MFVGFLALAGCSEESSNGDNVQVETVRSAQRRDTAPALSSSEADTLATGQAGFAVDVLKAVANLPDRENADVFLSPHSISVALGMTYAGARGETASEMKKALHFDLPDDRIHTGFNYLDLALSSRGKNAKGRDAQPFRLNASNSIWIQKGTSFEPRFLDTLAVNYGAGINLLDFENDSDNSRHTINRWVEEKTEDRIKDLLPKEVITPATRSVLVNAVYFNAAWAQKFSEGATAPAPFTKVDGSTTQVAMMHGGGNYPYAKGDGYEAIELPYDGDELSMLVIAPTSGTYRSFESALTGGKVLDILAGLSTRRVKLSFPKVKMEAALSLKESLEALGMKKAFTDAADFSGMSSTIHLVLTDVVHKTFLALDENGTEAAAATAVVARETSAPLDDVEMSVDRPFITAIVDRQTKTLVFLGRILEPKS
ncbi:MAG TPA: serpin family protein [Labilithrix sp.]|nr:serpin family protein [Labilithrix sp.]